MKRFYHLPPSPAFTHKMFFASCCHEFKRGLVCMVLCVIVFLTQIKQQCKGSQADDLLDI